MSTAPWRTVGVQSSVYQNGSYTQVHARRTLDDPRPAPVTTAPAEKKKGFPPQLKSYVARAFEHIEADEREAVEKQLKKIITDAHEQDVIWTLDWDNMPLPQAMLRSQAQGASSMDIDSIGAAQSISFGLASKRADSTTPKTPTSTNVLYYDQSRKRKSPTQSKENGFGQSDKRTRFDVESHRLSKFGGRDSVDTLKNQYSKLDVNNHSNNGKPVPVVGRCTTLEKQYFRLTSEPNPDAVRPLHILEQTLELLKRKWKRENNYNYICDQFKSMRQDLTVQHIKNEFTVEVYEIHARIALEKGDLGEYNQCQTQLASLYRIVNSGHPFEFKAYRILYLLHTCNRSDINEVLADLTIAEKKDPAIQHALNVRAAIAYGNYHRLFKLYLDAPNMGAYLMDSFMPRERLAALTAICTAYRPSIDITFLSEELGFESVLECANFLCDHGAKDFIDDSDASHPKLRTAAARPVFEEAKQAAFKRVDIKGQI